MPHEGCRKIASTFNRLHRHKNESVGKTYVASLAKRRALAILNLRKKLKNRVTTEGPRNLTWAADLTFLPTSLPVLGIVDHGTRALISLRAVRKRTTIALLRIVLDAVEFFGTPRFLRTDNEAIFASPLFTLALRLVGIRHQRTDRFCPWQNGRIERVFGTLKQRLILSWSDVGVPENPQIDLDVVRVWYNHVRPHQALRGRTPSESWNPRTRGQLRYFSAWNGLLSGFGRST
jgi:putative transposase